MSRTKKSRAPKTDEPSYTGVEINNFLDHRVSRWNHVRDAAEDVWIVADASHGGGVRGFHVVTHDGAWRRVVTEPTALAAARRRPRAGRPAPRR